MSKSLKQQVNNKVWCNIEFQIWGKSQMPETSHQVHNQVHNQVLNRVYDQVWDQVLYKTHNKVWRDNKYKLKNTGLE